MNCEKWKWCHEQINRTNPAVIKQTVIYEEKKELGDWWKKILFEIINLTEVPHLVYITQDARTLKKIPVGKQNGANFDYYFIKKK